MELMERGDDVDSVLFVGTYPPRECGIATFTRDLSDAIENRFFSHLRVKILAMNNNGVNIYNYPKKVIYQIRDTERNDYVNVAKRINQNDNIKLVSIQHEFGIFGGELGIYLIDFLKKLNKPKVITFHSILPNPEKKRIQVVKKIEANVDEIVVMTQTGVEILTNEYGLNRDKIKVIPHGIPTVDFERQSSMKRQLGYEGKIVLSSFGMINSGKGYEYVIEALPEIVKKFPNLIYLIVGATHPVVRKNEGESYRNMLDSKIKELGLQNNVKFYNKYVTNAEIIQYLKASDIYISSVLTPEQITSGTLAYAVGCGRVTVSTPFIHAKDLEANNAVILTKDFRNADSFKEAILNVLGDQKKMRDMEETAYELTRKMTWPNVALSYGEEIRKYLKLPEICFERLPKVRTLHIRKMTDDFGMLQFARYSKPVLSSGYTLDDNARALLVAARLYARDKNPRFLELTRIYLSYMKFVQSDEGKFYNFVNKKRIVDGNSWSEEAQGRAMRALGFLTSLQTLPKELRADAEMMLSKSLEIIGEINAPRAVASIIMGLYYYNKENYSKENVGLIKKLAGSLVKLYENNSSEDWKWFEPELTYSNSKIAEALLYAYMTTQNENYFKTGIETLEFLNSKTFEGNLFVPIGQNGWYKKGGERAYFDQQPVDVATMVQTLVLAYKLTKNPDYEKKALTAFHWFLGRNALKQVIYNERTGGCFDGIDEKDANLNQGAESTLAYLNARLIVEELE